MRFCSLLGVCVVIVLTFTNKASAELFVAEEFRYRSVAAPENIAGYGTFNDEVLNVHTGIGFNSNDASGFSNVANPPGTSQNLWTSDVSGANGFHRFQAGFDVANSDFSVFGDLTNYDGGALRGGHLKRSAFTGQSTAYREFDTTDGAAGNVVAADTTVYMSVLMSPENTNSNSWLGLSSAGDLSLTAQSPQFVDDATQDNAFGFRLYSPDGADPVNSTDGIIEGLRMTDGTAIGSGTFETRSSSLGGTAERLYFTADEKFMLIMEYNWGSSSDSLNVYKVTEAQANLATANGGNLYTDLSSFDSLSMSVNFNQNQLTGVSAWDNGNTKTSQFYIGSSLSDVAPGLFDLDTVDIEITGQTGGGDLITPAFTFGTWDNPPANPNTFDNSGPSLVINDTYNQALTPANGGAGYGFGGSDPSFNASAHALEIDAQLLGDNAADRFRVLLSDVDGDDSGPGLGVEDYIYFIDTSNFNVSGLTTLTIPLENYDETQIRFGSINNGDGIQNFDLNRISIQSLAEDINEDPNGKLAIDIASVRIVPFTPPAFDPADLNQDGFVDGLDLGILLGSWNQTTTPDAGELNGIPPVDGLDLGILLGAWNPPPPLAISVPEPTSALLLLGMSLGLLAYRRN